MIEFMGHTFKGKEADLDLLILTVVCTKCDLTLGTKILNFTKCGNDHCISHVRIVWDKPCPNSDNLLVKGLRELTKV